jgi:hypothetical protein
LNLLNLPPTVEAGGPYSVYEGSTVVLTANGTDPENKPLTFAWDLDNDGSFEASGQVVSFDATALTAPGTYTVRVQATDIGGETAVDESTVSVLFNWNGFFKPIANLPEVNVVNAGSAIPIKFNLTGDHGLDVISAGYPIAQQVACDTGAPISDPVQVVIIAATYDPLVDQYIFVWKTDTTWKGTCQQLQVQLIDGTIHVAIFKFR